MKKLVTLAALGALTLLPGCGDKYRPSSGPRLTFSLSSDIGTFFTHDFYVTNKSGLDLSNCRLHFVIKDPEGNSFPGDRRFNSWSDGERIHLCVSIQNTTTRPQEFIMHMEYTYKGKSCSSGSFCWSLN